MDFKVWLERIETPPHMPHSFWRDALKRAEELESKFIPMEKIKRMEDELEDEEYVDMRLSREFPFSVERIIKGEKKLSEAIRSLLEDGELLKHRPDLYWGEFGVVARVDILGDHKDSATRYTREYSEFFLKRKKYVNYGEVEKALPEMKPENRDKVARLKEAYRAVFEYTRLLLRVGRAVRSTLAQRNHKVKAFYAGGDESKMVPETGRVEVLYHATPYVREILREGFKTKEQLGIESLGGDTSGGISFTADIRVAREIAKCLKEVIAIAKGRLGVNDVLKLINSERKRGDMPWALQDYINKAKNRQWRWNSTGARELSAATGKPLPGKPYEINDREEAFNLYRRYLAWSDKRYDPLFFGVDPKNFERMDENNVGVVAAKVDMTKVISYHHAMEEYRAPLDSILSVHAPGRFS